MGSPSGDKDDYNLDFLPKDQADALKKKYEPYFFQNSLLLSYLRDSNFVEMLLEKELEKDHAVSPLMQILSITLHKGQDDGSPSEIYGTIVIDDGEGPYIPIYNRAAHDPQRVRNGGRLMLSMPKGCRAIVPSNKVDIQFSLLSRNQKISNDDDDEMKGIGQATYSWDFTEFSDYDIPKQSKINGALGFVIVEYVVYRHALSVTVDATLLKKEEDDSGVNFAQVYGTISARCGNKFLTNLFEKERSEAVMVEYGSSIEHLSAVVVIPVWAPFVIEAELWSCNPSKILADGDTDSYVLVDIGSTSRMIEGEGGIIKAEVRWCPAFMQIPTGDDTHDLFPVVKKMRIAPDQQPLMVETIKRNLLSDLRRSLEQTDYILYEVFSISVHNSNKKEFSVWGSIRVVPHSPADQFFFKKEKASAERLGHNRRIPIMCSRPLECMKGFSLCVELDLKDDDDCVVSYGRVEWVPVDLKKPMSSYGKKLCSVTKGDDGYYTAVYCSIFEGGVQAVVKVYLIAKCSAMKYAKVYGYVQSRYSTFKYFTIDDYEFYTRKLYERRIDESPLSFTQPKILLSESSLWVPKNCALLVDVDMKANSWVDFRAADSTDDELKDTAIFSTASNIERWVSGETLDHQMDHQIEVIVEWKNVLKCC